MSNEEPHAEASLRFSSHDVKLVELMQYFATLAPSELSGRGFREKDKDGKLYYVMQEKPLIYYVPWQNVIFGFEAFPPRGVLFIRPGTKNVVRM